MRSGISFTLSAPDRLRLQALVADRNTPQKHVWRARIVLLSADGLGTHAIMREAGVSKTVVWRWQDRFAQEGIDGLLRDKTRPARIPPLGPEVAARVVALTQGDPPGETTHWTAAAMSKVAAISMSSVQRIWRGHGLQPHRVRQFKLPTDPAFSAKLRDVVGLYVDPPAHAVLPMLSCFRSMRRADPGARPHAEPIADEAGPTDDVYPRLQAPRNDDPVCRSGRAGGQGDRPLHAAPPASGVHPLPQRGRVGGTGGQDRPRDPGQLCRSQAPKVRAWLERHPRWTFHFTPTSAPWLDAVEGFFAKLARRRLQRGVFGSLIKVQAAIKRFIAESNGNPKPFVWTADPDRIIQASKRGHQVLDSNR